MARGDGGHITGNGHGQWFTRGSTCSLISLAKSYVPMTGTNLGGTTAASVICSSACRASLDGAMARAEAWSCEVISA